MKIAPIVLALCLGAVPAPSIVAAPIEQSLIFATVIPPNDFKVTPSTPWPTSPHNIPYDNVTGNFTAYENELTILSNPAKITARVEHDPKLQHIGDLAVTIPVEVKLGTVVLSTTKKIVHQGNGTAKSQLKIVPTGKGYSEGTYTGEIKLIFEVQ